MLPAIRQFPSRWFYGSILRDSDSVLHREKVRKAVSDSDKPLGVDWPWTPFSAPLQAPESKRSLSQVLCEKLPPVAVVDGPKLFASMRSRSSSNAQGGSDLKASVEQALATAKGFMKSKSHAYENAHEAAIAAIVAREWLKSAERKLEEAGGGEFARWQSWLKTKPWASEPRSKSKSKSRSSDETMVPPELPPASMRHEVGIITPYRRQASLVRKLLASMLGHARAACIEVSTVDGFQG